MHEAALWIGLWFCVPALGDDSFHTRQKADTWLRLGGYRSVVLLNLRGPHTDPEIHTRARRIVNRHALLPVAQTWASGKGDLPGLQYLDPGLLQYKSGGQRSWKVSDTWIGRYITLYYQEARVYLAVAWRSDYVSENEIFSAATRLFCQDILRRGCPRPAVYTLLHLMRAHKHCRPDTSPATEEED